MGILAYFDILWYNKNTGVGARYIPDSDAGMNDLLRCFTEKQLEFR
jgi:hypothetical protein